MLLKYLFKNKDFEFLNKKGPKKLNPFKYQIRIKKISSYLLAGTLDTRGTFSIFQFTFSFTSVVQLKRLSLLLI